MNEKMEQATEMKEPTISSELGISQERYNDIREKLANVCRQFFTEDQYETRVDAIKLAIEQVNPQTIVEAVYLGGALEKCLANSQDPIRILKHLLSK